LLQIQRDRDYDYDRDPYFDTPWSYRYGLGGNYRQTNQYGADLLRQAVGYGYQEGFRTGDADRQDRWAFDYQDSFAYRDANYGYEGRYVDQSDYNYYFREGFRRGYEDGFYARTTYGRPTDGKVTVMDVVVSGILKLEMIR